MIKRILNSIEDFPADAVICACWRDPEGWQLYMGDRVFVATA
jgi:hypothetical protein